MKRYKKANQYMSKYLGEKKTKIVQYAYQACKRQASDHTGQPLHIALIISQSLRRNHPLLLLLIRAFVHSAWNKSTR